MPPDPRSSSPYPHHVIAIDGPAASGKSTVSRLLAKEIGFVYVNSGEMYRAVTWAVLAAGVDPANAAAVWNCVRGLAIECAVARDADGERTSTVRIDGHYPGAALRDADVNASVSAVSSVPRVRELLVARQRDYARIADIVMEGRDIGSVVFPETAFKFFITASEEVREARRRAEGGHTDPIAARDRQDSTRQASPLVVAGEAVTIDTSELEIRQVLARMRSILLQKGLALTPSSTDS